MDLSDLPIFGGPPPRSTQGVWSWVWSWDEMDLLVGTGIEDMTIVSRADYADVDDNR